MKLGQGIIFMKTLVISTKLAKHRILTAKQKQVTTTSQNNILSLHCCGWCSTKLLLSKEICQAAF